MLTPDLFRNKLFLFGALPIFLVYIWRYFNRKGWLCYTDNKSNQEILSKCPSIVKNVFTPTIYLQHRLLQTMFASLLSAPVSNTTFLIEEVDMRGGGHTSLAWAQNTETDPNSNHSKVLVVVIPGLTGSAKDNYVKDLVHGICKEGYKCVVYQPRFNGGKLILPNKGYLNILEDFKATINHIKANHKNVKLFGIGHSYGANLLVNYLGTNNNDNAFVGAISLANPFNLMLGEVKLRKSVVDRAITNFLQKTADRSKKELSEAIRFKLNIEELSSFKTVRDFDRNFTIKVYGYETVEDYYWGISSCRRLGSVNIPLFMLQAEDDPVVEAKAFVKEEIEKNNPNVILMMTTTGGHQGWIEGFFRLRRWYLKPTLEFLNAVVDGKSI